MKQGLLLVLVILGLSSCKITEAQSTSNTCLEKRIEEIKNQDTANPPISIYQYTYKGQVVYHISAPCCDMYTSLIDKNCNLICHPSGGITGKGDGKCSDFFNARTDEKMIWADPRKPN